VSRLIELLAIRPGEGFKSSLVISIMLLTAAGAALGGTGIEALFFARFGVDYLPYMFFGLGLMNMLTSFGITASLSRISRSLLYIYMPALLAIVILLARLALLTEWNWVYPVLWLSKEILNTLIGLLVWGLANMVCDTRQAKRLFPLFNASRILGAVVGGFTTGALVAVIGTENLLLVWAGTMFVTFIISGVLVRTVQTAAAQARPPRRARVGLREDIRRGFRQVQRSPLLRWVAIASVLFSVLYFSISLPFSRAATQRYANENDLAAFLGIFNGLSTAAAFLASLFLANKLFARVGIMTSLLIFPMIYLVGFAGLALVDVFIMVVVFRFAQTLWLSGIADPAYQAMFNVIPPERRDQARTFIDGVPGQAGIMIAGLILIVGEQTLEPRQLYLIGLATAALCAYVLWQARRGYHAELVEALQAGRQTFFFKEQGPFSGFQQDAATFAAALGGLHHNDPAIRLIATEFVGTRSEPHVIHQLINKVNDTDPLVRVAAIRSLVQGRVHAGLEEIAASLHDTEPEVRLEAVSAISEFADVFPGAGVLLVGMLKDPEPRVSTRAAISILKVQKRPLGGKAAGTKAKKLLRLMALTGTSAERAAAIAALGEGSDRDAFKFLTTKLGSRSRSPAVRNSLSAALARLDATRSIPYLVDALRDPDQSVRATAARLLGAIGRQALDPVLAALNRSAYQDGALKALEALPPPPQEPILKLIRNEVARTEEYDGLMRGVRSARLTRGERELQPQDALLVEALRHKSFEYGARAVRGLGLLTDRAGMSLAVEQLHSRHPAYRAAALEMIDSHNARWDNILQSVLNIWEDHGTTTIPLTWERLLTDQDAWVRACAAYAARTVNGRSLHRRLNTLAKSDPDLFVRDAARPKGKTMKSNAMLSLMDRILFLKRVPLFAHLSPGDLKQVAVIAKEASFKAGDVLAEEGEQGDVLFVIVEGEVVVTTPDASGQIMELARRGAGEYVGEMAILTREPRMATMVAAGESYALTIDQSSFEGLLRERPDVSMSIIHELSARIKQTTDLLEQMKSQSRQPA
jgi:HEAT repeat protein